MNNKKYDWWFEEYQTYQDNLLQEKAKDKEMVVELVVELLLVQELLARELLVQ